MNKYDVKSVSYIGKPLDNSAMFVTKKVEHLLENLNDVKECLVFAEDTIEVPTHLAEKHEFVLSSNPQGSYTEFVVKLEKEKFEFNKNRVYKTVNGSMIGENVQIGDGAFIEPNCFIDHDVIIGKNAFIKYGSVIRNSIIGDNFFCNEKAVIGSTAFTMAPNANGDLIRIPTLGKVILGNNVEIGANCNISCGTAGNTVMEDNVKLDALIHIGHDSIMRKNVELTAGVTISGFCEIDEGCFVGVGSLTRNRIKIGKNNTIGMGSVITKDFDDNNVIVGNPAKVLRKKD